MLKTIYQPAGQVQMASLLQSFFSYMLKPKATVDSTASKLTVIQSDICLIDLAQVPSEQAKLAILLLLFQCLDAAYKPVILHIESTKSPNFATTVSQLKDAEHQIVEADSTSKTHDTALSAGSPSGKKRGKGKGKGKDGKDGKGSKKSKEPPARFKARECWHCHSTEHKRPQCPEYLKT